MKCLLVMHLLGLGLWSYLHAQPSTLCGIDSQTTNNSQGLVVYDGDKAGDAGPDYNYSDLGANNLKNYYTIEPFKINNSITSGFWFNTGSDAILQYNGVNNINTKKSTVFRLQGVKDTFNSDQNLTTRMHINAAGPAIQLNKIGIASIQSALNGSDYHLNYWLIVTIVDVSNNTKTDVTPMTSIDSGRKIINFTNPYTLMPGKSYEIQFRVANTNGYTTAYLDNPEIYGVPIPVPRNTTFSICNTTTNISELNSVLSSPTSIVGSKGTSVIRWFLNTSTTPYSGNLVVGTYTPYYFYNNSCYYPAGAKVQVYSGLPTVNQNPSNVTICSGNNAQFTSSGSNNPSSYSWQVSTDGGATFLYLTDGGVYSGVRTNTLNITNVPSSYSNFRYRMVLSNSCGLVASASASLNVNTQPIITSQPKAQAICVNSNTSFSVSGTSISSYRWQVSTDNGGTFTNISNGATYSGVTTSTLNLINVPATYSNYRYRVVLTNSCGTVNSSVVSLTVTQATTPQIETIPATCDEDGSAKISNYSSSQTYLFAPLGPVVASDGRITGLKTGIVYTVSSANGSCTSSASSSFSVEAKKDCACYEAPNKSGPGLTSSFGITLLRRSDVGAQSWPGIRKSAHMVLESNSKGFVITRISTDNLSNITNPQEGMMVYDTTARCLKIFADQKWSCFSTPACP